MTDKTRFAGSGYSQPKGSEKNVVHNRSSNTLSIEAFNGERDYLFANFTGATSVTLLKHIVDNICNVDISYNRLEGTKKSI